MALSANTVWEVRTDGNDTNGGGFVTGASGTDWSQQAAAQYSVTDGVTNGTTTITSATANFGTDVVGNLIYVQGGTGSVAAGWYEIVSRTNSTTIVVDRSTGLTAGTGVTLKIGGALASPGGLGAALMAGGMTAGQKAYVKSGTYNLSSTTANASGGVLNLNDAALTNKTFYLKGYQTSRTDYTGTSPIINTNGQTGTYVVVQLGGNTAGPQTIDNFEFEGNLTNNSSRAVVGNNGTASFVINCEARGFRGAQHFGSATCLGCKAYGGASTNIGFASCECVLCWADQCGTNGFSIQGNACINCIASNCGADGFNGQLGYFHQCVSYNCTGDGFECNNVVRPSPCINCVSFSDAGYGWRDKTNTYLINCAYGADGGGSGRTSSTPLADLNPITLTADPFTNAAGGDFSLNNTAGGGALLRAAGWDTYWFTNHQDVGAIQHADAGGGGGQQIVSAGGGSKSI